MPTEMKKVDKSDMPTEIKKVDKSDMPTEIKKVDKCLMLLTLWRLGDLNLCIAWEVGPPLDKALEKGLK